MINIELEMKIAVIFMFNIKGDGNKMMIANGECL